MSFLITAAVTFVLAGILPRLVLFLVQMLGLWTTVGECRARVYVLFGQVLGVLTEPGLHCPAIELGPRAALVPIFGQVYEVDLRIDQRYLRSQPVNSEEGTPMGIGVWYEMRIVRSPERIRDYLFENTDPAGSLQANVTNATVRCLSNMPLADMLQNRHSMSRVVRAEVSPKSEKWGYELGSVYVRKVHFRDRQMIEQIEQKVVNRLRQVTSAIRQAGANQVDIVKSAAEKEAAVEFARAEAVRPQLVGEALAEIARDPEVLQATFDVLEAEKLLAGSAELVLVPRGGANELLKPLLAARVEAG
jgi:regulator of protease activity HflC (stomatin/prohibitin superfamily)